jgi:surface protein
MRKQDLYDQIILDIARIVKHRINECCETSEKHINEDYIDGIGQDDIVQDFDFVKDDVVTALTNIMNGTPSPYDIDPWKYVEHYNSIYSPKDTIELKNLIALAIEKLGYKCSLNWIDVSYISNFNSLFFQSKFNGNISRWNTSRATEMSYMFYQSKFNGDISSWNVSRVKDMSGMFYESKFNKPIGEWDVRNVEQMQVMFCECKFNQDISRWNVSKVEDMTRMFCENPAFDQDISSWNVSNVEHMSAMFKHTKFNQDISGWNVSKVLDMSEMFFANTSFNQDLSSWNVSKVTTMRRMFSYTNFNADISGWDISSVYDFRDMFYVSNFCLDLTAWSSKMNPKASTKDMFYHSEVPRAYRPKHLKRK